MNERAGCSSAHLRKNSWTPREIRTTTTVISLYLAGIPEGESAERVLPISQRARMHFTRAENEGEQKKGPLRISDGGEVRIGITIEQLI